MALKENTWGSQRSAQSPTRLYALSTSWAVRISFHNLVEQVRLHYPQELVIIENAKTARNDEGFISQ